MGGSIAGRLEISQLRLPLPRDPEFYTVLSDQVLHIFDRVRGNMDKQQIIWCALHGEMLSLGLPEMLHPRPSLGWHGSPDRLTHYFEKQIWHDRRRNGTGNYHGEGQNRRIA